MDFKFWEKTLLIIFAKKQEECLLIYRVLLSHTENAENGTFSGKYLVFFST